MEKLDIKKSLIQTNSLIVLIERYIELLKNNINTLENVLDLKEVNNDELLDCSCQNNGINFNPYYDIRKFVIKDESGNIKQTESSEMSIVFEYLCRNSTQINNFIGIPFDKELRILNSSGNIMNESNVQKSLQHLKNAGLINNRNAEESYEICFSNVLPSTRSLNNGQETINLRYLYLINIDTITKIPVKYREIIGNLLDPTMTKTNRLPLFYTINHGTYSAEDIIDAIQRSTNDTYIVSAFHKFWLKKETNCIFIYHKDEDKYSLNFKSLY